MLNKWQESTVFFIFKRQYIVFHLATFFKLTDLPNSSSICLRRSLFLSHFSRIQPGSLSSQPNALSLTVHHPLSAHLHVTLILKLLPACPLTLSTLSYNSLSTSLMFSFWSPFPNLHSHLSSSRWPSSPCLLIFNFLSDYFGELTSTRSRISHLHPSPSSLP